MTTMRQTAPPLGLAVLLAALGAVGPFAIDTYLPSFHAIGQSLGATPLEVQQTLTAYMIPFSFMALWHGAISDAVGRRSVLLVSQVVFALACLGCIFATRIEHLWLFRAIQGLSAGAGIVVSRAVVRDLYDGPLATKLISHIAMMFAFAPAIAPLIGGRLEAMFGWRSVFAFLTLMTALLAFACWRSMPETLPREKRQSLHPSYLARAYAKVLTSPFFLLASIGLMCNFGGFFLYVMSAPAFLIHRLGLPATQFLWLFGPAMLGLMCGAWITGRLAHKLRPIKLIRRGYLIMAVAALGNVLLNAFVPPAVPWTLLPIPIYTLGMSMVVPNLTLLALDPFPEQRGLAASTQMFLQAGGNALIAGIVAPYLWGSTLTLAFGMTGFMATGAVATLLHHRLTRRRQATATAR